MPPIRKSQPIAILAAMVDSHGKAMAAMPMMMSRMPSARNHPQWAAISRRISASAASISACEVCWAMDHLAERQNQHGQSPGKLASDVDPDCPEEGCMTL